MEQTTGATEPVKKGYPYMNILILVFFVITIILLIYIALLYNQVKEQCIAACKNSSFVYNITR